MEGLVLAHLQVTDEGQRDKYWLVWFYSYINLNQSHLLIFLLFELLL
jgi:hypothetical protein